MNDLSKDKETQNRFGWIPLHPLCDEVTAANCCNGIEDGNTSDVCVDSLPWLPECVWVHLRMLA